MARPRKDTPSETDPEIALAMKEATVRWGIPSAVLKAAKLDGCPAFEKSGRIYKTPLMAWIEKNSDKAAAATEMDLRKADKHALEEERLRQQILLLKAKHEREQGNVIPRDLARAEWTRAAAIFQEEAKMLMEKDLYRTWIERCKTKIGNLME